MALFAFKLAAQTSFLAAAAWSGEKLGGAGAAGGVAVTVAVAPVLLFRLAILRPAAVAASSSAAVNIVHTAIQPGRCEVGDAGGKKGCCGDAGGDEGGGGA